MTSAGRSLRRRSRPVVLAVAGVAGLLLVGAACDDGVRSERALDARLVVDGAQFVEGAMPPDGAGPRVVSLDLSSNAVRAGQTRAPLRGALDPAATAAAVGLVGDRGYWVVPAGLPDVAAPGFPTFDARLSFASSLSSGPQTLVVRAVDARDRFGPAESRELRVSAPGAPEGALVVSLSWDTDADLDLHVVDPSGVEIWKGDVTSQVPDGGASGGELDVDAGAGCVADGRRRENVVWGAAPPPGRYVVRVDTFSLCASSYATWRVEVRANGARLGAAEGQSGETDTTFPHGRGAGLVALELHVP